MSLPLLRKEIHEHGIVFAFALVVSGLALIAILIDADEQGGRFIGLTRYVLAIGMLNALILSNRLFVREYAGRTQLFLETLPLGRTQVFVTKWVLGCALMLLTTLIAWLANFWWIQQTEVLPLRNALGALLNVSLFSLVLWAFAAMAGMLGRYRYVAWIGAVLVVFALFVVGGIATGDMPVFRLLGIDVQMALGMLDVRSLLVAAAISVAFTAAAAALALIGSGAMASALAQRMTARELVFVLAAAMVFITLVATLRPKPTPPPFEIAGGEILRGEHVSVGVMQTADLDRTAAQSLSRTLVHDLETIIAALNLETRASVFILPQQGLDRTVMQRAPLSDSEGIVLKIAPDAPRDSVRALALHSLLGDVTLGRGLKEDRHVLLDGLSAFWVLQNDSEAAARWWLRAASIDAPVHESDLTQWSSTSEQLGECLSQAFAFSVVHSLAERVGREPMLQLFGLLFAPPADDLRVLLETPPVDLLARAGVTWAQLAADTDTALTNVRHTEHAILSHRPQLIPTVTWSDSATQGLTIEASLAGAQQYSVFYTLLQPWSADIGDMPRLDVRGQRAVLPISPPHGARVLTAIEVEDEALGCPVRIHAQRVQLP